MLARISAISRRGSSAAGQFRAVASMNPSWARNPHRQYGDLLMRGRARARRRWLVVRDHYSRRLAAYMGVMVDAEAPGERPLI